MIKNKGFSENYKSLKALYFPCHFLIPKSYPAMLSNPKSYICME